MGENFNKNSFNIRKILLNSRDLKGKRDIILSKYKFPVFTYSDLIFLYKENN